MGTADFIPKRRLLQNVTLAEISTFTTTEDHGYNVGDVVSIVVPLCYGMDIDFVHVTILSVPSASTFTTSLNTLPYKPFVVPAAPYTEAHVVPVAGQSTNNIAR